MISATALVLIGTPDCALHNMSTHMMLPEDLYKPRSLMALEYEAASYTAS
jgi:hypothetical protein